MPATKITEAFQQITRGRQTQWTIYSAFIVRTTFHGFYEKFSKEDDVASGAEVHEMVVDVEPMSCSSHELVLHNRTSTLVTANDCLRLAENGNFLLWEGLHTFRYFFTGCGSTSRAGLSYGVRHIRNLGGGWGVQHAYEENRSTFAENKSSPLSYAARTRICTKYSLGWYKT